MGILIMAMLIETDDSRNNRRPWRWTELQEKRVEDVMRVLVEFKPYLPMTLRQLYYQILHYTDQDHWFAIYKGKRQQVDIEGALGRVMKWLRIEERIDRDLIIDEHRIITTKMGVTDRQTFIEQELANLGRGYARCNAQKQPRHIEVWLEKEALLRFVEPIADEFCRRVVCCRGYNSITFQTEFYERAMEALSYDQVPTILYFGDWDPSGEDMPYALMKTIRDELGLHHVECHRGGVNPEHFPLIRKNPVPIKPADTRSKSFVKRHGSTAYELDALHPEQLKALVRDELTKLTDMDLYEQNKEQELEDWDYLVQWRSDVREYAAERAGLI
jgi:hypothetical protein